MKVLFDIGNTRTKYVLLVQDKQSAIHYVETSAISSSWLSANFIDASHCLVANVSQDKVSQIINLWCQEHKVNCQLLQSEKQNFGIRCAYQDPERFGVDRWLALVGAAQQFSQQDCLIIDAGTATTVDLLTADGQHQGGWILPGIHLLFSSLLSNTEKIAAQSKLIDKVSFADNTSDAVNQASWAATLSLIESAKQISQQQYGVSDRQLIVIFTGGNATPLAKLYSGQARVIDNLVFIGMQAYC